jgi:DNA-binding response OmpR family regulator
VKILLVEDDDRIAKPLAEDLKHQQHVVDMAADGLTGWEQPFQGAFLGFLF